MGKVVTPARFRTTMVSASGDAYPFISWGVRAMKILYRWIILLTLVLPLSPAWACKPSTVISTARSRQCDRRFSKLFRQYRGKLDGTGTFDATGNFVETVTARHVRRLGHCGFLADYRL